MNKILSWKFLIPIGIILWFFNGVIRLLGVIVFLIGLIDLFRWFKSKRVVTDKEPKTK